MKLCFPLSSSNHAMIISAYALTLASCDDNKEAFCENLNSFIKCTPASDKLIVLGNFSAGVDGDYESWKGVLGPHGLGQMNRNVLLLLTMCAENNLAITNTLFRLANKYKVILIHPRSKQWNLIDCVITCRQDICDIKMTTALLGAECWTDHRLVRSFFSLHIAPVHCRKPKLTCHIQHHQSGTPSWQGEVSFTSQ